MKNAPRQSDTSGSTTSGEDKQGEAIDQDPSTWSTGGEAATQKQKAYSELSLFLSHYRGKCTSIGILTYCYYLVAAMAKKADENVNLGGLDKGEASKKIEELKDETGM